jgi:hypothetical protein
VSGDVHTPTNAGPDNEPFGTTAGAAAVEAGSGDNPEVLVGAAFAGGLVAALILKRFVRND